MKLRVESGLTGQIGNAKIVLEIKQREERITNLKVDQPVNTENAIDMMTTTITVQTIVAGRDHGRVKEP